MHTNRESLETYTVMYMDSISLHYILDHFISQVHVQLKLEGTSHRTIYAMMNNYFKNVCCSEKEIIFLALFQVDISHNSHE